MLIDITRPLSPTTAVWPGDLPTQHKRVATLSETCLVNCHELHISLHAATHLDAPYHYDNTGKTIDQLDPTLFVGPATVLHMPHPCPDPITPKDLQSAVTTLAPSTGNGSAPALSTGTLFHPRLLLATHAWPDSTAFPTQYPTLTKEAVDFLAQNQVHLLGLDLPSVDKYPAKTIPIHLALNKHNILILESLNLTKAPPGHYELLALPLNLPNMEASPVRALLRPLP